jgi:membrane protease YdiL (CAAX protease family)
MKEQAFWSYEDLMLFLGSTLPAFLIAMLAVRPVHFPSEGVKQIVFQSVFYSLLMIVLYFLIARYGRQVWKSLGWTLYFPGSWWYAIAGPVLAIGLAALAAVLHAPAETVIENLVSDRLSQIVVMLFVSLFGPLFEEMVFRGFLLPLFARSAGDWAGILMSSIPFALLHGPTVHWAWQSMMVIGLAGVAFGMARVRAGSTTAGALVHVGYNSTLFIGFLAQRLTQS